jgi:hypothetical protein
MKNLEKQAQLLSQRVQSLSQGGPGAPEEAPPQKPKRAPRKKDEEE